jgi:hypothetical protein
MNKVQGDEAIALDVEGFAWDSPAFASELGRNLFVRDGRLDHDDLLFVGRKHYNQIIIGASVGTNSSTKLSQFTLKGKLREKSQ